MDTVIIQTISKYVEMPYKTLNEINAIANEALNCKSFDPLHCRQRVRDLIPHLEPEDETQIMGYIAVIALDRFQHKVVRDHMLSAKDYDTLKDECKGVVFVAMKTYKYDNSVSSYMGTCMKNHIVDYYNRLQKVRINPHDFKKMAMIVEYVAKHGGVVDVETMARDLKISKCCAKRLYTAHRINNSYDDELAIEAYSNVPSLEETYIRETEERDFIKNLAAAAMAVYELEIAYAIMLFTKMWSRNKIAQLVLRVRLFLKYLNDSPYADCQDFINRVHTGLCVADFEGLHSFLKSDEEKRAVKYAFFRAENDIKAIEDGIATEEECLGNKLNLNYQLNQIFPTSTTPKSKMGLLRAKQFKKELNIRGLNKIAERLGV